MSIKFNYFHLCENVIYSKDGQVSVINDFDQVNFAMPDAKKEEKDKIKGGVFEFWAVGNISTSTGKHTAELEIKDKNEKVLADPKSSIEVKKENKRVSFLWKLTIIFENAGEYTVRFIVDDEEQYITTFTVNFNKK